MTQTITQAVIQDTKAATTARGPAKSRRPVHAMPRASRPALRKLTFNYKGQDKYSELNNFKFTVRNIFMRKIIWKRAK